MVKVWNEKVNIPTYEVGEPEKNPMFLEKRVYQGSTGVVYPYPVIEKIHDEKHDKEYNAYYLENEYIKVMILPELGGRVQMAWDKVRNRHFVYYNSVVKPALVGLTGPWISGGIEFNWPQHHRPSTFMPVDCTIEKLDDGGATIWVNEQERMFHQKGAAGFTLRPGKAVLEIQGRVENPTPFPQTFLWWANPAVSVNDYFQSVFPPDVNAVFDHGKRDVSSFPIATGTYYKVDYSEGVDISNYKNIPVPTSYMAIESEYNFVGGYENDSKGGVLHVANHHYSPGKKQWTWGYGDFGQAWDRNLTDSDGPYIELMTGVYTDNQPDFSWLQPYETKEFVQYFMPYGELGVVKNASSEIMLNVSQEGEKIAVKIFSTSDKKNLKIVLENDSQTILETIADISPENLFIHHLSGTLSKNVTLSVYRENGELLLDWHSKGDADREIPKAAEPALLPEQIETTEQLFLTGLHLEQYRHANYNPIDYYTEALRRDPSDVRNNNALGLKLMRQGQFEKAEQYLRTAIQTQLQRNPNPYDGEPHYNLGMCLKYQGKLNEAYKYLYKSCWNSAMQDAGYYTLAQISTSKADYADAMECICKSLNRNYTSDRARALKAALRYKTGKDATQWIDESLKIDGFNFGCLFIDYLIGRTSKESITSLMRSDSHNYQEIAIDFMSAGLWDMAVGVLELAPKPSPMALYYKAYSQFNQGVAYAETLLEASVADPKCCFPNRLEDIAILRWAISSNSGDAKAPYYLGNLFYDKRQYKEAIALWELSSSVDAKYPTVWRNLALAYFNKNNNAELAMKCLRKAFDLDKTDPRVLMELDQLSKRLNESHKSRLDRLEEYKQVVFERDDLYLEYATLHNNLGYHEKALELINSRKFHPWEGGEGKVPTQYQMANLEIAKKAIKNRDYQKAVKHIEACYDYPHNLGEGKLTGAQENDFNFYMAEAISALGNIKEAKKLYTKASSGKSEPAAAIFYNDQKPDKIFYQILSLLALGNTAEAEKRSNRLVEYATEHIADSIIMDYFAVSLPDMLIWEDDLNRRNVIHCNYIMALGYLGLGNKSKAEEFFKKVLEMDNNHQGAIVHSSL